MSSQRRHKAGTNDVEVLVAGLTLDQVRTAAARLTGKKVSFKTKEEALELLDVTGKIRREEIIRALRTVEALTPAHHCAFLPMASWPAATLVKNVDSRLADKDSRLNFHFEQDGDLYFVFEFSVRVQDWTTSADGNTKRRKVHQLRHPRVARLSRQGDSAVCIVTYPGFTHALEDRTDYESLMVRTTTELEALGCVFTTFPVKSAILSLIKAGSRKFSVTKVTQGRFAKGTFALNSADPLLGVESVLAPAISEQFAETKASVPPEVVAKAVALAIQNADADALVLHWFDEKISTRIEFWNSGADFLLHWGAQDRTFFALEQIFHAMFPAAEQAPDGVKAIWAHFLSREFEDVVLASDLVARFAVKAPEVEKALDQGLRSGVIQPVYRLRGADQLVEAMSWTTKLTSLRKSFETQNHDFIDGTDPANVLVGFRRVSRGVNDE